MTDARTPAPVATGAHALPVHEVVLLLETDLETGLADDEAAHRLAHIGPNELPRVPGPGPLARFLGQLRNPLIYVLLGAAAVTAVIGEWIEAGVILGVVVVNAIVGFLQEARAERALEALTEMVSAHATVVRGGRATRIPSPRIVPGDLLALRAGDRVAADVRLVRAHDLQADEAPLTGESEPVAKATLELPAPAELPDRRNMAFTGTLVTRGEGLGLVVATGGDTEFGLIHRLIGEVGEVETPLTRKITVVARQLTVAILALAALAFGLGLAQGEPAHDVVLAAVALAVGAIPEGLPAAMTVTLAIGVARMARRRAIVRRLPAVETLGSTTVVCSDKTGTLTKNEMTVEGVEAGEERWSPADGGPPPGGGPLRECLLAGVLCSDARVEHDGDRRLVGDPTETALLVAAMRAGLDPSALRAAHPRLGVVPFDPRRRWMATAHVVDGERRLYAKGAVEAVTDRCAAGTAPHALDPDALAARANELAVRGHRVLVLAERRLGDGEQVAPDAVRDLRILGLQALRDPPRPEAIEAVAACHRAGIAVKMVTGDHAVTARAIGEQMGIARPGSPVVEGARLAELDGGALEAVVRESDVFARVSPEQKLRLVEALRAQGEIVAMTGDGVNDAPALKQADIGIAMGRGGTEVARESSDLVLADDNFATIRAAIEEGRRIFDNLTKFLVWTLPTNAGEGMLVLVALAVGATLPILPVQILWINMTTAGALGITLAFEVAEPNVMRRPPRDPRRPVITGALVERMLLVSLVLVFGAFALFEWELARGASDAEARTVAVNVFVAVEALYLFSCRSLERSALSLGLLSNRWLLVGVAVMIVLQLLFTYAPALHELFGSAPLDLAAWVRIAVVAIAGWALVTLEKGVRRRRAARR